MLYIGYNKLEKIDIIKEYISKHEIKKVFVLTHENYNLDLDYSTFNYGDLTLYKVFYSLRELIDNDSLVIVNECLRRKYRYDLTYNCIRNYLNQTNHKLIFNYLPIIDEFRDYFTLIDWETKNEFKRDFDNDVAIKAVANVKVKDIVINTIDLETNDKLISFYNSTKEKLFNNLGKKDPHTLPRELYLASGKEKLKHISSDKNYIGRNNRFKLSNLDTYKDFKNKDYTIFELPHNFLDLIDLIAISNQTKFDLLTFNLKVDAWYLERVSNWLKELRDVYSKIQ